MLSVVGNGHMHFTKINTSNLTYWKWTIGSLLLVGGNYLILRARPVDHHRHRQLPGPIEDQWFVATTIGKLQQARFPHHRRAFVLDPEVPLALSGRLGIRLACLLALSPTLETGKERLHAGIAGMGMELICGIPSHQVLWFQPDALVPHGSLERDKRLAIEPATLTG